MVLNQTPLTRGTDAAWAARYLIAQFKSRIPHNARVTPRWKRTIDSGLDWDGERPAKPSLRVESRVVVVAELGLVLEHAFPAVCVGSLKPVLPPESLAKGGLNCR